MFSLLHLAVPRFSMGLGVWGLLGAWGLRGVCLRHVWIVTNAVEAVEGLCWYIFVYVIKHSTVHLNYFSGRFLTRCKDVQSYW